MDTQSNVGIVESNERVPQGDGSRGGAENGVGLHPEIDLEDQEWIKSIARKIDEEKIECRNKEAAVLAGQGIITREDEEKVKAGEISQRYLETSGLYADLIRLSKWGVRSDTYLDDIAQLRNYHAPVEGDKVLRSELEHDPLIIYASELKKAQDDGIVKADQAPIFLKEAAEGIYKGVDLVIHQYKSWVMAKLEHFIGIGIFSEEEGQYLVENYLNRGDITVFGTPRRLEQGAILAYEVVKPLLERSRDAEAMAELKDAGVIDGGFWGDAVRLMKNGEGLTGEMSLLIKNLNDLKFAQERNIIKSKEEYRKAVGLLPVLAGIGREYKDTVEAPDTIAEAIATDEAGQGGQIETAQDPLHEVKINIRNLVLALEVPLKFGLNEFGEVFHSTNLDSLDKMEALLADITRELATPESVDESRREEMTKQIRSEIVRYQQG